MTIDFPPNLHFRVRGIKPYFDLHKDNAKTLDRTTQ